MESQLLKVPRTGAVPLSLDWDGGPWRTCPTFCLDHFMGVRPQHFPRVAARLACREDRYLDILFRVHDQFVVARATGDQQMVCHDSCVEFFWSPGTDVSLGYFNLEINCGGHILMHYQRIPRKNSVPIAQEHLQRIKRLHSMPASVPVELPEPVQWTVACRLPLSILGHYFPVPIDPPAHGTRWRANLFKCADHSTHPHWLCWAPVDHPTPDFHRPDCFGTLQF